MLLLGRIQTRNYEDDNGQKHFITEVVAEEAYFADSKKDFSQMVNDLNSPAPTTSITDEFQSDDDLPF